MTPADDSRATLTELDAATRCLVRVAAVLAGSTEEQVRSELHRASTTTPHKWIEELLLQTYLFAGFPRALNGTREWRRIVGKAGDGCSEAARSVDVKTRGEYTCARVYGEMYERLRENIRDLHPLLDEWMIVEGYGKVLSRPELDLGRRELCIVAACAATGQDRQLQSHLHGARNVGVPERVVTESLLSLDTLIPEALLSRATRLWDRIRNDLH